METLPCEIQTIIYKDYWLDYYNKNVIKELKSYIAKIYMETLPWEIQTIIYQYYWSDHYNKVVINEMNDLIFKFSIMNMFLRHHFIFNRNDNYDKQICYYLKKYNTLLTKTKENKGLHLFATNFRKYDNNIFNKRYIAILSNEVSKDYINVCIYCIQLEAEYRFAIMDKFKKLSKYKF